MGSGCLGSPTINNCGTSTSSTCVKYVGEAVPALGICTNDTITEVMTVIVDQIQDLLSGTGITLNQVTLANCPYLSQMFLNKSKSLSNLLQLLVDANCSLKAMIDAINITLNTQPFTFDLKCLPTIESPTRDKILQQVITSFCELSDTVNTLVSSSGDTTIITSSIASALNNLVTSAGNKGVKKSVDANGISSYYFTGLALPYSMSLYGGPLGVFDNTGLGIIGTYAEGYAICNGNNGTIDMRGFVGVGAIQGVPGPSLDPIVDPVANANATMNYSTGGKGGTAFVKLTGDQNGPHTHTTNEVPHTHDILGIRGGDNNDNSNVTRFAGGDKNQGENSFYFTNTSACQPTSTGITINSSGTGSPIENRMPYKAAVWVMRLNN